MLDLPKQAEAITFFSSLSKNLKVNNELFLTRPPDTKNAQILQTWRSLGPLNLFEIVKNSNIDIAMESNEEGDSWLSFGRRDYPTGSYYIGQLDADKK